jgi:hypothetical protein
MIALPRGQGPDPCIEAFRAAYGAKNDPLLFYNVRGPRFDVHSTLAFVSLE